MIRVALVFIISGVRAASAASRLILIAGDIVINTPPRPAARRDRHTQHPKETETFLRAFVTQRNEKRGGDSAAASPANPARGAAAADQWRAAAGAGARTRPRPRFAPAFYLLLRGTARATGV